MERFTLSLLVGLFTLTSTAFAQYGSTGQHYLFSGDRRIAVIMLAWQDTPCPATRQTMVDRVWNGNQSTRKYFLDMSRGLLDCVPPADADASGVVPASTSAVYGPYTLSIADGYHTDVTYNTLVENGLTTSGSRYMDGSHAIARDLAAQRDGFRSRDYDYIIYVTPKGPSTGGTGGYAGVQDYYQHIYVARQNYINHEMGHSLGLAHSNTSIDVDGYGSQDCIMGNQSNPHLDAVHTYNMGWYPDAVFSIQSYGQHTIENLAQPGTDNVKVVRFDRSAHGATTRSNYDLWVSYRVRGVGHDSDLNSNWDRKVNIHYCLGASDRPTDPVANQDHFNWWGWVYYYNNNNVTKFLPGGSYTDPDDGLCKVRFLREDNSGNQSAVVQFINPNGNQPPSIPAQDIVISTNDTSFTIQTNDPEDNPLSYTIVSQPAQGTLGVSGDTFTLNGAVIGTYSFTVRVNDGQYDSFDVTIPLQVVGLNPPTADAGADQTVTIQEGTGGGNPVAGAWFEWDAAQDTDGNSTWESTTANTYNWTFDGGALSPVSISDPRFDRLTNAYAFPAAMDASNNNWNSYDSGNSATFEFVIDIDGTDGCIFETGATGDGLEIDIVGGVLRLSVEEDPTDARASYELTAEDMGRFIHVVAVADNVNDVVQLYVDGQLKDSQPWTTGDDWSGTDGAGLGADSGNVVDGGSKADFSGKMALFRFYKNKALTGSEVTTNLQSLSNGYGAVATLEGTVEDADGTTPSATWSVVSTAPAGMSVLFGNSSSATTTALFVEPGTYTLRLTADDGVYTDTDDVVITVNAPTTSGYSSWAGLYDLGAQDGMADNPDGDKRSNMMEFALGTDPSTRDNGSLAIDGSRHGDPVSKKEPGTGFWFYFMRRTDHGSSGSVSYTAYFSSNLETFTDSMVGLEVVATSSTDSNYEVVRVPFPEGAKFASLRVEAAP